MPSDVTGKIATMTFGDSKKAKVARHAVSGTGGAFALVMLLNQFPGLVPYVVADTAYDTLKETVTTVRVENKSVTEEFKEFKSEYRVDQRDTQTLLRQILTSRGVVPAVPDKPDTVIVKVPVVVNGADTIVVDTAGNRPR